MRFGILLVLALSLIAPGQALAWGSQGHKLIADLAYSRLTPVAKAKVEGIIAAGQGGEDTTCALDSFTAAATWPDCVRGRRAKGFGWTTPLHYEDRPLCPQVKADPCPGGRCVTHAIETALAVLKDPSSDPVKRLQALAYVEHFVGDMHQPLHLTDNGDKGGNAVQALYPRHSKPQTLHAIWDTQLVKAAVGGDGQRLWKVQARILLNAGAWSKGSIADWAAQSHDLGVAAYQGLPQVPPCGAAPTDVEVLSPAYVDRALPVVEDQLGRAAVRLAVLLNQALS